MTIRFTLAEKWQDLWFRKLSPIEKLLFIYMCDNCNIAGIWEIDLEQAAFSIGVIFDEMKAAYKGLARGYETLDENHIWVKNFLKHQRNLPLNPSNAAHAAIINLLLPYKDLSANILQLLSTEEIKGLTRGLQAPISICIGKGISKSNSNSKSKDKVKHADYIYLLPVEHQKLCKKFGEQKAQQFIDELSERKGMNGKRYKSDYLAILTYDRNGWFAISKKGKTIDDIAALAEEQKKQGIL